MDKHPATPSAVLLADLLLELNQPEVASMEYKEVLRTDPNRFRSILGTARAAKQSGDAAAAHDAYQKLVTLSKPAATERPELAEAKAYLTN
jgi:cytochrome c-type biogenesis protein CcmH/NrfG